MAAPLPDTIQLKLDQALAQWRHWDCDPPLGAPPLTGAVLGAGHSNHSILVHGPCDLVVRIDGVDPASNHLNRAVEWRCLQAGHAAGIAPRPVYFNPQLGCLVCEYLAPDPVQDPTLPAVGRLLRSIHSLPPRHQRLDIGARILSLEKQLQHRDGPGLARLFSHRKAVARSLEAAQQEQRDLVLCHNDLLQANRIASGGRLWAIDWEYCAMANPWYDLAVIAAGDALDCAATAELLEGYLDRTPTPTEYARLHRFACVYQYLELLWYLARQPALLSSDQVAARLRRLENALERAVSP